MVAAVPVPIPTEELAEFCRREGIKELSIFGSALSDRFGPDSDIDILVEFEPDARIGYSFVRIQRELGVMFGRHVDLVLKKGLKTLLRDDVLGSARVIYAS